MDALRLHKYALKLKGIERQGWVVKGIKDCESVADHSFGISILTLAMAKKLKLDMERCLQLALIHDLPESITGDITPHDKVPQKKKHDDERKAIAKIAKEAGFPLIVGLIKEYHENKTKESRLVHDMDKIEMVVQAKRYEKMTRKKLPEFYREIENKLEFKESKMMLQSLL